MRLKIKIPLLIIAALLAMTAELCAAPKNFDVTIRRDDTYILKNGSRWDWGGEDYSDHLEKWMARYWTTPKIFSFRNGRVLMKRDIKIEYPVGTEHFRMDYVIKEVIQGIFDGGSFTGKSTSYNEIYQYRSGDKYIIPQGLYYKGWRGGEVTGKYDKKTSILELREHYNWNRGLVRRWVQIKDSDGKHKGYRSGDWEQIPHYENTDTYVGIYRLKLPRRYYNEALVKQPDFEMPDPNRETEGVAMNESMATTGGPGGGAPAPGEPGQEGTAAEKPKGKVQTGDVDFASGDESEFKEISKRKRSSPDAPEEEFPTDDPWEEKTPAEKAASAAGAAAAGTAAAAAGAAAIMGTSGMKKEDVLDAIKEVTGKSDKTSPDTTGEVPELDAFEQQEKELNAKGWFYDDERGGFVPGKGATNDKGQVWAEDPYEPGSVRFIDKEELDQYDKQKASGKVWVENGSMRGWHDPKDVQQQADHDAYVNSDKFTAEQEKIFRQMDKDKAAEQLANNKDYQEWKKLKEQHTEMTKDVIREDMDYEIQRADRWNQRAEKMGKIADGAAIVKKGADETINLAATVVPALRPLKYAYNSVSETAGSIATDGNVVKGVGKGLVKLTKDVVGDKIGDKIPIGNPKDMGGQSAGNVVANLTTKKGVVQVSKTIVDIKKGKIIGGDIDKLTASTEESLFGPKETVDPREMGTESTPDDGDYYEYESDDQSYDEQDQPENDDDDRDYDDYDDDDRDDSDDDYDDDYDDDDDSDDDYDDDYDDDDDDDDDDYDDY